jgi:RNA polymerase sigma-70 factor (ECF subfamily)
MSDTNESLAARDAANLALMNAQIALFGYVCALVGDAEEARDVLQEVNLKICRQLDAYDPSRPFLPWARTIAYFEVLSYRNHRSRDRLTLVDDTFFESVAAAAEAAFDEAGSDLAHLEACLRKLPALARGLVEGHYFRHVAVKSLARRHRCSANAVSLLLFKARRNLAACIQAARAGEVAP